MLQRTHNTHATYSIVVDNKPQWSSYSSVLGTDDGWSQVPKNELALYRF